MESCAAIDQLLVVVMNWPAIVDMNLVDIHDWNDPNANFQRRYALRLVDRECDSDGEWVDPWGGESEAAICDYLRYLSDLAHLRDITAVAELRRIAVAATRILSEVDVVGRQLVSETSTEWPVIITRVESSNQSVIGDLLTELRLEANSSELVPAVTVLKNPSLAKDVCACLIKLSYFSRLLVDEALEHRYGDAENLCSVQSDEFWYWWHLETDFYSDSALRCGDYLDQLRELIRIRPCFSIHDPESCALVHKIALKSLMLDRPGDKGWKLSWFRHGFEVVDILTEGQVSDPRFGLITLGVARANSRGKPEDEAKLREGIMDTLRTNHGKVLLSVDCKQLLEKIRFN